MGDELKRAPTKIRIRSKHHVRMRKEPSTIFRLFAVSAQSQIFSPQIPYGHFLKARLEDRIQYSKDKYHPYQLHHIY
jgi:hypothetical protein